jgi:hypothetical protein
MKKKEEDQGRGSMIERRKKWGRASDIGLYLD